MSVRALVLGGEGMLGHRLVEELRGQGLEVFAAVRGDGNRLKLTRTLENGHMVCHFDARSFHSIFSVIKRVRPTAVVNAIGLIKQRSEGADTDALLDINAIFPHRLSEACEGLGARLIQISTDCVFSGIRGSYTEDDLPDATDAYGRTKHLGEVTREPFLTLRTSIIGRELSGQFGLVEWFLAQSGVVPGFRRARFSGLTTGVFARLVGRLLLEHPRLTGLFHVAAEPMDKLTLLQEIGRRLAPLTQIAPADKPVIDRTLDGSKFLAATGLHVPSWNEMLNELQAGSHKYDEWRVTA